MTKGHRHKQKISLNKEYADLVPSQPEEEYEAMKESIKEHGLLNPLLINQNGVLLDGYHRHKACMELGISPAYKIINTKNEFEEKLLVIDSNLKRRQLNNFQRVELALKSKPILEEIAKRNTTSNLPSVRNLTVGDKGKDDRNLTPLGRVDEQIGKLAGVSRDTVEKVQGILEIISPSGRLGGIGENLHRDLTTGEISINNAAKLVQYHKPITDEEAIIDGELEALSWLDAYADMNKAIDKFWRAFTNGEKVAPYSREDVINDFIKPYREFRRRIIFELETHQLLTSNNQLIATSQMISDTIRIYKEAIDKRNLSGTQTF
jgi:hypothetical protein